MGDAASLAIFPSDVRASRNMTFSLSLASKPSVWIGLLALGNSFSASAAVSYSAIGGSYTQNFDSLANTGTANAWVNDLTLPGWHAAQVSTATTNWIDYAAAAGAAFQGRLLSIGASGSADRALGGQNANTTGSPLPVSTMYYGLQFANSTGSTLTAFSLGYAGEQWRVVQNEARDSMVLQYQIFAAGTGSITAASGWTAVSSLGFDAPIMSSDPSASLPGNNAANRVLVNGGVSGISWAAGSELWLRWGDSSSGDSAGAGGTRSMLAIDDVTFSAIPEPSGLLLSGLGFGLLGVRRRR